MSTRIKRQRVKLSLSASQLKNQAPFFRTSSPFAIVTLLATIGSGEDPQVLGRTETIPNTLHPQWTKSFTIDYELGKELFIDMSIYDEDDNRQNKAKGSSKSKKMGYARVEIGKILGTKRNRLVKNISQGGVLFAHVAPLAQSSMDEVQLCLSADLKKGTNAYYEIHKKDEFKSGAVWTPIYRSNIVRKGQYPKWEESHFLLSDIIENVHIRDAHVAPLRIMVWSHHKRKRHSIVGSVETNVTSLFQNCAQGGAFQLMKGSEVGEQTIMVQSIHLIEEEGQETSVPQDCPRNGDVSSAVSDIGENGDTNTDAHGGTHEEIGYGTRSLPHPIPVPAAPSPPSLSGQVRPFTSTPNFVDYLCGGCHLNLMIAIDFTSSNGDPRTPGTPHYQGDQTMMTVTTMNSFSKSRNEYEKAVIAMGDILVRYDSDQQFPVWGFGAKFEGITRHIFQVGDNSTVSGVNGILQAYRSTFERGIIMSSPVILSHVMRKAAMVAIQNFESAIQMGNKQSYSILLILTHGCVSDMDDAMETLREISDAPLSIIIVGIGQNDFEPMRALDDFQNEESGRDICNFVEFDSNLDRSVLTRATLNEIPDQLVSYFTQRGIFPKEPGSSRADSDYDSKGSTGDTDGNDSDAVENDASTILEEAECDVTHTFDSDDEIIIEGKGGYIPREY